MLPALANAAPVPRRDRRLLLFPRTNSTLIPATLAAASAEAARHIQQGLDMTRI